MSTMTEQRFTVGEYGEYYASPSELDLAMSRYLPASPALLRSLVADATGVTHDEVRTVAEFLVILAHTDRLAGRL